MKHTQLGVSSTLRVDLIKLIRLKESIIMTLGNFDFASDLIATHYLNDDNSCDNTRIVVNTKRRTYFFNTNMKKIGCIVSSSRTIA